jgi:hypothetical protein
MCYLIIFWHLDPLLGNDFESSYTIAVVKQWLRKQASSHGNDYIDVFCAVRA